MKKRVIIFLPNEHKSEITKGEKVIFTNDGHQATVKDITLADRNIIIDFDDNSTLIYANMPFSYCQIPEEAQID